MRATPRYLMRSAAVLTGAILLTAAWALIQEPPPLTSCRLADGSVLRLEAVTRGPVHEFKGGPYWQRLLARAPFPSLRALAGDPIQEFRGATPDSLALWTTRKAPVGGISSVSAEVINERGCSYEADRRISAISAKRTANQLLEAWEAVAAPRRGRKLGLRARTSEGDYVLMTPNPLPGPYPEWSPSPLPITKQSGELGVTLNSLATGPEILCTGPRTFPMNPDWLEAHIRLAWAGKPSAGWMPAGVTLWDPTGNVLEAPIDSLHRHDDKEDFQFSAAFCADEPVWKLRLELVPCPLSSIDPADLWIIPWLPLPRSPVFSQIAAPFSRQGVTVRVWGLAGPWARVPAKDRRSLLVRKSSSPVITVDVESTLPVPGVRLRLVRAVDDRGRSIQHPDTGGTSLSEGRFGFGLRTAPDARKVRLVFAVVKSRFVEFVVRPPRP
jgi:hypothetical protein